MSIQAILFAIQQIPPICGGEPTQPSFPIFAIELANRNRRGIGALGEHIAADLLQRSGYRVSHCQSGQKRGDLQAINIETGETHRVEVKTARRCKDKKWRFTLYLKGKTNHHHADIVMLLAVLESGRVVPFIVPVEILWEQHQATITSHPDTYKGKLAAYRQQGMIQLCPS